MTITIADVRAAADTIAGQVLRTPSVDSLELSYRSGAQVTLKLENLQHTGSFKVRGALNRLAELDAAGRQAGVVAASAGNHAQGVAFHARRMAIPAIIVMPRETPFTKVARTEALGARVVLHGDDLTAAHKHALEIAASGGQTFIHPYDDPAIIAGQGTVALEMLADTPDLDTLIIPIGGGGLIGGMAVAAKAINPRIDIVGVEAALYPSMRQAMRGGPLMAGGPTVAEGIAVKSPGRLTRPIIEDMVSDILLVTEMALEVAIQIYLEAQGLVVEGAGAAGLAALMGNRARFAGRRVGLVVSGGNIDARLLASILMRGLARAGRLVRLRIEISDQPGSLARVTHVIGAGGGNIIEINHQRLFHDVPVKRAELDVLVETLDAAHVRRLIEAMAEAGFVARLLGGTVETDVG